MVLVNGPKGSCRIRSSAQSLLVAQHCVDNLQAGIPTCLCGNSQLISKQDEASVVYRKDIDAIERVQCRDTRLIPGRARLSHEEPLKERGLDSLERRR